MQSTGRSFFTSLRMTSLSRVSRNSRSLDFLVKDFYTEFHENPAHDLVTSPGSFMDRLTSSLPKTLFFYSTKNACNALLCAEIPYISIYTASTGTVIKHRLVFAQGAGGGGGTAVKRHMQRAPCVWFVTIWTYNVKQRAAALIKLEK
jgi:hypothetical protein